MATSASTTSTGPVRVAPITTVDARRVAEFLHREMNSEIPVDAWEGSLRVPWRTGEDRLGAVLLDGDSVVGAYVAYFSERELNGRVERFCNLGTWCVLEPYRMHSLTLLKALLADDDCHFVDLSPASAVSSLNGRLGFEALDTKAFAKPNLPVPSWPGRGAVSSDPAVLERTLTGRDLDVYRDHVGAQAALHFVLVPREGGYCYVVARREQRKGVPVVVLLHIGEPAIYRRMAGRFGRHLLVRHRAVAHIAEDRQVARRPSLCIDAPPATRMFRSRRLAPSQIDYLYSELVCLPA